MAKESKDFSKYFDFSGAKVISEDQSGKTIRLNGRDIHIVSEPDYRQEKQRGKEEIQVHYENAVPEELKHLGVGKKYLIYTYGCQMNEHDTEVMRGLFEEMGYVSTEDRMQADVILYNTCAVRENAEDKVFGELGHMKVLKQQRPELILGVCGCMSQEASVVNRIMQKHAHVDMIFGTHNIHRLPHLLQEAHYGKEMVIDVWSKEGDIIENLPKKRTEGLRAWVNIMYGCDKFCTYCIVPYTRGKERSRLPEDVIAEVRELARQGFKEITLLGQNVNAYGKDFTDRGYRFGDLMNDIHKIDIPRVRFTTSHPRDFDDHLIEVLAKGGNLVEHIHLPVQSGSTEVLKRMSRKYTRERYLELAERIRKEIPNAVLTTDVIVGFPGETEEQFEDTMSLMREAGITSAYTYIYSPREGTPAYDMTDDVPLEVKQKRLARLNALVGELSLKHHNELIGQVIEVLVEGESKNKSTVLSGRSRSNKLIHFEGDKEWIGKFVQVKVTAAQTWYVKAEVVSEPMAASFAG
ncbi:tRNA (N6-isopentenyl adenosine(37)-C2)-methylthiotransferase MiaB [Cohnella lupini]|uniref:tRNA-2-methylthio-N(6)-dimethylallyladenosine synthase n=1 Tax=Cohnella lupini TaxID=1294267 RepID=A0A3D9IWL8_9BACL|nr:tRNA (N6-isopentenyl adenosine(37)-C2)-methylthiotransferase MiaB [Cohnella lupini]RED66111.1 tRNA-2-methylthio-N6-dimethylallyladenosine synthase [Cohnella lupini]